jgi:hypothetical protein
MASSIGEPQEHFGSSTPWILVRSAFKELHWCRNLVCNVLNFFWTATFISGQPPLFLDDHLYFWTATFFSGQPPLFLDNHLYFQILLFFRSSFWIYLSVTFVFPYWSNVTGINLQWHLIYRWSKLFTFYF